MFETEIKKMPYASNASRPPQSGGLGSLGRLPAELLQGNILPHAIVDDKSLSTFSRVSRAAAQVAYGCAASLVKKDMQAIFQAAESATILATPNTSLVPPPSFGGPKVAAAQSYLTKLARGTPLTAGLRAMAPAKERRGFSDPLLLHREALTYVAIATARSMPSSYEREATASCKRLREATVRWPLSSEAHRAFGHANLDDNRWKDAEASFRRAVTLAPHGAMTRADLAFALYLQGQFVEAATCYQRALALEPNCPALHLNLSIVYTALDRLEEAENSCRKALASCGDDPAAHQQLGKVLYQKGSKEEAVFSYKRSMQLYLSADIFADLLQALLELGRWDEAKKIFDRVCPQALFRSGQSFSIDCNIGLLLLHFKNEGCWEYLVAAARSRPDSAKLQRACGEGYLLGRNWPNAAEYLAAALVLEPQSGLTHQLMGKLYSFQDNYPQMEASYRRALELAPATAEAHYGLAEALCYQNLFAEGEECYRAALAMRPDYFEALRDLAFALRMQGKRQQGLASIEQALRLMPEDFLALCEMGATLLNMHRFSQAERWLRQALDKMPADGPTQRLLQQALAGQAQRPADTIQQARCKPRTRGGR